jgi:DNA-directed RNA polymerase beta' subunit
MPAKLVFPLPFLILRFRPKKLIILADAEKQVDKTERMFRRGIMSSDERHRKVIDIWTKATDDVGNKLMEDRHGSLQSYPYDG